jgi:PAS domain S-box-containing protein
MPKISGLELLRKARSKSLNTINILFTGYAEMDTTIEAINSGLVWRYVTKPIDLKEIEIVLRQAAEQHQLKVENRNLTKQLLKSKKSLERKVELRTRAIKASERKYRNLIETALTGIAIIQDAKIVYCNSRTCEILGYKKKEILGKDLCELIISKDNKKVTGLINARLEGNRLLKPIEVAWQNKNGNRIITELSGVLSEHKGRSALEINFVDITDRIKALNSLQESERRFSTLFRESLDAILIVDAQSGKVLLMNKAVRRILGYEEQNLIGQPFSILFPSDSEKDYDTILKELRTYDNVFLEQDFLRADGGVIPVDLTGTLINWNHGKAILVNLRDITERMQAEVMIRTQKNYFEALFNSTLQAIVTLDLNQKVVDLNPQFEALFVYSLKEIKGKKIDDIIVPETRLTEAKKITKQVLEGDVAREETVRQRKDGSLVHVTIGGAPILVDGKKVGIFGIYEDISERKRVMAEVQMAKDVAEAASRAKSDFLANISHEIRTPLNGILGYAELLMEEQLNEEQIESVKVIRDSGKYLLTLINEILDLSKIEALGIKLESKTFELSKVLNDQIRVVRPRIYDKPIDLILRISKNVPMELVGDPTRIGQIVLNLLSNAAKFTDKGVITLSVGKGNWPIYQKDIFPLQISVKDTGIGIPVEKQQAIFETFTQVDSSTTRKYEGTGLGLAITKKLVELMGGKIWLESELGKGSIFTLCVPLKYSSKKDGLTKSLLDESEFKDQEEKRSFEYIFKNSVTSDQQVGDEFYTIDYGQEKVSDISSIRLEETNPGVEDIWTPHLLLVEDNEMNWRLFKKILIRQGYRVTVVENGVEALKALEVDNFDLVLIDMQMPIMDGYEATERIRQNPRFEQLPIIALTAYAMVGDAEKCRQVGCDDYIIKPINTKRFLQCIRSHLKKQVSNKQQTVQMRDSLDEDIQRELDKLKGNFIENLAERYSLLLKAWKAENFNQIEFIGHGLKGSGSTYGFDEISQLGMEIEMACKSENIKKLRKLIHRLGKFLKEKTVVNTM